MCQLNDHNTSQLKGEQQAVAEECGHVDFLSRERGMTGVHVPKQIRNTEVQGSRPQHGDAIHNSSKTNRQQEYSATNVDISTRNGGTLQRINCVQDAIKWDILCMCVEVMVHVETW